MIKENNLVTKGVTVKILKATYYKIFCNAIYLE